MSAPIEPSPVALTPSCITDYRAPSAHAQSVIPHLIRQPTLLWQERDTC
nr:MAG TPA: hypothetical protein [Caudoviricetes sp.]